MTEPLHPDHLRLLAIASAAFRARDNTALWKKAPDDAITAHASATDRLWAELERQLAAVMPLDMGVGE